MPASIAQSIRDYAASLPPGARLLPEKALAHHIGCSVRTVHTHLKSLAAEGLVIRRRGSGTFVPDVDPAQPAPAPGRDAVTALADAIDNEINHGRFRQGDVLPQVKRMAADTGTGPATVVKAYALLRQRGSVYKAGKSFRVGTLSDTLRPARRKRIHFVNNGRHGFNELYRCDPFRYAYRSMEKELQRNGCLPLHTLPADLPALLRSWEQGKDVPDGLVLCAFRNTDYQRFSPQLLGLDRRLAHRMPPMLIDWRRGRLQQRPPTAKIITWGNVMRASVKALVTYLLRNEWDNAAVFMHADGFVWNFEASPLFLFAISGHMGARNGACGIRYLLQPVSTTPDHIHWLRTERVPEVLRDHLGSGHGFDTAAYTRHIDITPRFETRYRKLLNTPVWIFDRSADAAAALGWLRKQGVRVPDDIAVITLEDDPAFLHLGMTVCSPDWEMLGYQMAHAVIRDFPVATTDRGFLKAPGAVVEKLTTP